jgi:AraC-like DNA-binding protein
MVHLLQVYSNRAPRVVSPQELIFQSTSRKRQQDTRATLRRARQLRASETELLVTHYLAVRNIGTVAREFQVSRTTVARVLTEQGIDASRRMTDAQISVAAELYEQGLSSAAIGQRLGFDNHTILKALRSRSVAIRPVIGQRSRRTDRTGEVI